MSLLYKTERNRQHEAMSLPTQQETTCVYMSSADRLFAAGDTLLMSNVTNESFL